MIENKRNKIKELPKVEDINKMEIASDLMNTALIIKIKNDEVFRNVSFSHVEKEEEKEKDNRGIINETENESKSKNEKNEDMNDNNEENILPSFPTKDLANIKEKKSLSTLSEYHEMKTQMEIDKKVNEKVIHAFNRNEFQELASEILQNTFRNLFSEVLYGEYPLYLPSSPRMESEP